MPILRHQPQCTDINGIIFTGCCRDIYFGLIVLTFTRGLPTPLGSIDLLLSAQATELDLLPLHLIESLDASPLVLRDLEARRLKEL